MTVLQQWWQYKHPPVDPHWDKVNLLMQFNGNVNDALGGAFTQATGATGGFTTVNAKFGQSLIIGGSAPNGGGPQAVHSTVASTAWDFGNEDFTMEGFMLFYGLPNRPRTLIRIADNAAGYGNDEYQLFNDGGSQTFYCSFRTGVGSVTSANTGVSVIGKNNVWFHLAMCRQGNQYYVWVDGVGGSIGTSSSYRPPAGPKQVIIGNLYPGFVDAHYGMVDSIRLTKGVARYTAPFTPPSAPFTLG